MNFLVTMKLSDGSLRNHILPIAHLRSVEGITIVRDTPGPSMNKVKYITPSDSGDNSSILTALIKMVKLVRFSLIERPSLIHSYMLFPHGYLAFIAGKLTKRRVGVSLLAGPVETYVMGGSPIGKYAYCCPLPRPNMINRVTLSVLKRFDIITVPGTYTKNYLIDNGIKENRIFVLPHAVDDKFRPLDIKKDYDIVFVGRLAPVKHVETLIQATAHIKKTLPSIRVAIVGDGKERKNLEKLTLSLGLTERIDFVGYQPNTWEWYNRSRISVVTSEREGFPYTAIESLRCGVPVVSSDCGDIRDILKDSINGAIIPHYDDYNGFAEVILNLLKDSKRLSSLSTNALKSVEGLTPYSVESTWEVIVSAIAGEESN